MGLPPLESMSAADARAFVMAAMAAQRPPGPEVGEIVDGVLPGPGGDLPYRLYRPAEPTARTRSSCTSTAAAGCSAASTPTTRCAATCACARTRSSSRSNYRHAPEARFPAAVDDAFAAVQWVAANAVELGGIPGQLAVAGWSAGGNIAAVACQLARDAGGPEIAGQLLLTPGHRLRPDPAVLRGERATATCSPRR